MTGGFPNHTLTEDFALGQELMRHGYIGAYVERAYVMGDAPDALRTAFAQRSRWCKVGNKSNQLTAIVPWHALTRSLTSTSFDVIVSMVATQHAYLNANFIDVDWLTAHHHDICCCCRVPSRC
jgi:cellulose synthase/poly-beta-1,6-N-acetylglucosamine synthase-like glycosyltransferase